MFSVGLAPTGERCAVELIAPQFVLRTDSQETGVGTQDVVAKRPRLQNRTEDAAEGRVDRWDHVGQVTDEDIECRPSKAIAAAHERVSTKFPFNDVVAVFAHDHVGVISANHRIIASTAD